MPALEGGRVDVIVSDLGMAGMDGYAFIARRQRTASDTQGGATPAIALTAFARSEDRQRAYRAGSRCTWPSPSIRRSS